MNEYVIFTDSCCDIKPGLLEQWGVPYANMTFTFDGEDKEYINTDITNKDFYDRMRKGASAKTAAINADSFARAFAPILQDGKDILYTGKVLTHTFLTAKIWGSSWESDMASLRVHMATLRKKIERDQNTQYIQTHIGIGYRMLKLE